MKETAAELKSEYLNGLLYLEPIGEIDHHTAKALREKMDRDIYFYRPKAAVLSLGRISFMDSSGLGLILGRYTKLGDLGSKLKIEDPTDEILKILRLAGVDKLIEIVRTDRNGRRSAEKETVRAEDLTAKKGEDKDA